MISGHTRIAAVIGDPISHSLSPVMHNAAFAALDIDAVYVALHVRPPDLKHAVDGMRALGLMGFNVTVPHKEKIVRFMDTTGTSAQRTGAVNTVVRRGMELHGENTDVIGFRRALDEAAVELAGARVVLIGAGGAARAALAALIDAGATTVTVANRTRKRAHRLLADFDTAGLEGVPVGLDALQKPHFLEDATLVINSTSLGLRGEDFTPIDYRATAKNCVFFDLIPKAKTPFLLGARAARRPSIDGSGMLLHQGAAAFSLWTEREAPLAVMRKALERALRGR